MTDKCADLPVLSVKHLSIYFGGRGHAGLQVVNNVSFEVRAGEIVGIVGESGSGKSQILLSIMGLLPDGGRAAGSVRLLGREILGLPQSDLDGLRGAAMSMVFQDPMTCLTPHLRISRQMTEVLVRHRGMTERAALSAAVRMLELVQIPDARHRIQFYPHEFSGGMRQRVMVATSLLCRPAVLLADEPTTALDVTIQAQLLKLFADIAAEFGTAILIVTHDFGVVSELCDRIVVLYGGAVMETGLAPDIISDPQHPYTRGLLAAMPGLHQTPGTQLFTIPGQILPGANRPGCPFCQRCTDKIPVCATERPVLRAGSGRHIACHVAGRAEVVA